MRKTLIIISFFFIIAIGIGVYVLFFANHSAYVVVTKSNTTTQSSFPVVKENTSSTNITNNNRYTTGSINNGTGTTTSTTNTLARLVQISTGPVVPAIFSLDIKNNSTSTLTNAVVIIKYIDQQSGNIYQYNSLTGRQTRISNKTIPGINSAVWLSDGSLVYVRYISHTGNTGNGEIATYALPQNGIGGFFLPQELTQILTQGTDNILMVSSGENGSIIKSAQKDAANIYTAFQTPLTNIRVMFAGLKNYFIYTKPSADIGGYAFIVNKKTGMFTTVAGPKKGLTALINHAGTEALINYDSPDGLIKMGIISIPNHTMINLPISTISNKCVWSQDDTAIYCGIPEKTPVASYPDDWYQGKISFTDNIWKINMKNRYVKLLFNLTKENKKPFDIIAPSVDPKQHILSFINKRDGSLWSFRLQP